MINELGLPMLVIRAGCMNAKTVKDKSEYKRYRLIQIYRENSSEENIKSIYDLCINEMILSDGKVEII